MNKKKNVTNTSLPKRRSTAKREESGHTISWNHQAHQCLSFSQSISSSQLKAIKQFIATIMDENRQLHQTCDQLRTQISLLKIQIDAKQLEIKNITRLENNSSSFKSKYHRAKNRSSSVTRAKTNSEPKKMKVQRYQDEEISIQAEKEMFNFSRKLDQDEIDFSFSPSKPMPIKLYQQSLPIQSYLRHNPEIINLSYQKQIDGDNIDESSGPQSKMIKGRIQKLVSEYRLEKSLKCMVNSK